MKTLRLDDGDLVLSGGDYLSIEGTAKIGQDLEMVMRERIGSDPYHPYWGSVLPYFVGQPLTPDIRARMVAGVRRTLDNYIAVQNAESRAAAVKGVGSKLRSSEVVQSVSFIDIRDVGAGDGVQITVSLLTLSGENVVLTPAVA